jgi:hypothetical protein
MPTTRTLLVAALLASACTDDPVYVESTGAIEVGADDVTFTATSSTALPVRLEHQKEATCRAEKSAELGVMVPYVLRDDLDLSVEWTLKNLSDAPAVARVQLNGANEMFGYLPLAFVVDPEEEEAPPPLAGDVPFEMEPGETRDGVFREDELAEASLDLELITRGGVSPFAALLEVDEGMDEFDAAGVAVPSDTYASLVRVDLVLVADQHMVLEYTIRVRDHRDPHLLHSELADAPPGELTAFAPADYSPALP